MAEPAVKIPRISAEEYLERERDARLKHEYIDGVAYMMAGTTRRHNAIALDMRGLLRGKLPKPCEPYALDVKVEVKTSDKERYYYPDVVVTCSELDNDPLIVRQPVLLVEVMSASTSDYDRGDKFAAYRLLPSLLEYLLIEQDLVEVEVFRKRTGWKAERYMACDEIFLESVQLKVPVSALY